jgi:HEAT repeat protein
VAALEEPRTRTMTFADGSGFIRESPFARICELVGPHGSPATVPSLTQFVDHPIEHFRRNAALPLGNIGSAECVPAITKLLDDDDDYVRSFAMIGIERGIRGKHCTPEFLSGIFPALVKLLNRPDKSVSGNAPELLLIIDRERAIPILLSPEYFSSQNTELHYILRALNKAKCEVPLDQTNILSVTLTRNA